MLQSCTLREYLKRRANTASLTDRVSCRVQVQFEPFEFVPLNNHVDEFPQKVKPFVAQI